jgi:hypothetical protein
VDLVHGGRGNDNLEGGEDSDQLYGGKDDDLLNGVDGADDSLKGDGGHNLCFVDAGDEADDCRF